jgi:hypothetical protein
MVAVPLATAVSVKPTELLPAGTVTVDGTVATAVFDEERLKVTPPAGAAPESVSVCVVDPGAIVTGAGRVAVSVELAAMLAVPKPVADAVIVAVPMRFAVSVALPLGVVEPAGIVTEAALRVKTPEGLGEEIARFTTVSCATLFDSATGKADVCPGTNVPGLLRFSLEAKGVIDTVPCA